MPKKVRELEASLAKVGCLCKFTNGSHRIWSHPLLSRSITISGKKGADAKPYQIKDVRLFLEEIERKRGK